MKARADQEAASVSNSRSAAAAQRRRAWAGQRVLVAVLCAVVAATTVPTHAQDTSATVSALEASVREWLALRREWHRLRSEWQEEQRLLADEERLLQERVNALQGRMAQTETAATTAARALAESVAVQRGLQSALGAVAAAVAAAETHLGTWSERLPALLREPLRDSLADLPASPDDDLSTLAERAQRVVAIYTQLQQLSRGIHAGRMVLPDAAGREREVDVLFLGVAVGYALAADTDAAAVGRPTAAGWSWQWRPELASPVRRLFQCHRRDSPAALVSVPVWCGESQP